jgi:hypothetical protein
LPRLDLNLDPPDLCLLSSWDYRHEPQAPSDDFFFLFLKRSEKMATLPSRTQTITNAGEDVEKKESSYTAGRNIN